MFVDNFSAFSPSCNSVIVDDSILSTLGNDGSKCSVSKNTILRKPGDTSVTESSNVLMLDSGSCGDKSLTSCNFVISVKVDGSIEYKKISSEGGTAKDLAGVSESKILVGFENRKAWQPLSETWDYNFYLY